MLLWKIAIANSNLACKRAVLRPRQRQKTAALRSLQKSRKLELRSKTQKLVSMSRAPPI